MPPYVSLSIDSPHRGALCATACCVHMAVALLVGAFRRVRYTFLHQTLLVRTRPRGGPASMCRSAAPNSTTHLLDSSDLLVALGSSKTVRQYVTHDKFMSFWPPSQANSQANSARVTRRRRYCFSWRWRLWLHKGAKGPSGAPDRSILARAPALGRSRGVLGSR